MRDVSIISQPLPLTVYSNTLLFYEFNEEDELDFFI